MNKIFPKQGSIDLIFGRPFQTLNEWIKELAEVCCVQQICNFHDIQYQMLLNVSVLCLSLTSFQALELCGNHISLYQLTVEHGTPLSKSVRNCEIVRLCQ